MFLQWTVHYTLNVSRNSTIFCLNNNFIKNLLHECQKLRRIMVKISNINTSFHNSSKSLKELSTLTASIFDELTMVLNMDIIFKTSLCSETIFVKDLNPSNVPVNKIMLEISNEINTNVCALVDVRGVHVHVHVHACLHICMCFCLCVCIHVHVSLCVYVLVHECACEPVWFYFCCGTWVGMCRHV